MDLFALYLRVSVDDLARFEEDPARLYATPMQPALDEARALDLGRAWEDLGCLLEGGIKTPETGPTVGDQPLPTTVDGVLWSSVSSARVKEYAEGPMNLTKAQFLALCRVDEADTADFLPGERTGEWGDPTKYLFEKYRLLAALYRAAAAAGEAMLVRLGPQRRQRAR
jgi:hypothetical protein